MKNFGRFLRNLRQEAKLEIAEAALRLSIDAKKLSTWEEGFDLPSEESLNLISQLYRIRFEELREVWEDQKKISKG
jgi:transcriptional regulator with XRE-family HTH domain